MFGIATGFVHLYNATYSKQSIKLCRISGELNQHELRSCHFSVVAPVRYDELCAKGGGYLGLWLRSAFDITPSVKPSQINRVRIRRYCSGSLQLRHQAGCVA